MVKLTGKDFDMDMILMELGEFGRFQIKNFILICIAIMVLSPMSLSYVFTAGILQYRCNIPGCDQEPYNFSQTWVANAIPEKNGNPEKCSRYDRFLIPTDPIQCNNSSIFDSSQQVKCDAFIWKTSEVTLQNEFNLTCDENEWKLTLVGTLSNAGSFSSMTAMGILSDKFGRRTMFIYSLFATAIVGTIKSFSVNYVMYVICEFINSFIVSGTFATAIVLAIEMLGPNKRVFGGTLIHCSFSIGEILLGVIAMYTLNFRVLLRVIFCPMLFVLAYFWWIPESVRWLWVNGRNKEAANVVIKAAKTNKVKLSDDSLGLIYSYVPSQSKTWQAGDKDECDQMTSTPGSNKSNEIVKILRSRRLLLRMANCFLVWMTCAFVYYGLSLNSVTLAGNKYLNFMLVCAAEIPGYIVTNLIAGRFGRKWSLCSSLIVCGISCIGSLYVPADQSFGRLALFLLGKTAITVSFTVLYVFTSEMFPTSLRNTFILICSTVGRVGSISAPQTPLLAQYVPSLPLLLFGGLAITSGFTSLLFPETLNTSLPDTIEEAENIGENENES